MPVEFVRRPKGLGEPLGRYSHISIATGTELVTIAGQTGITDDGELAGDGSVTAQTRQVFRNLSTALESQGLGLGDVYKFTTYLVGAHNVEEFMAARTAVFAELYPDGQYPPNTLLVVARLVEERFLVEIEASAIGSA
jgi:enamine deaminase RidA (YjgF/YER057c/UK114 family)